VQLSFRVTPDLKRELDAAAKRSGRSQSQEAEIRLERSFDRQGLLSEVLSIAYGKELAKLLTLLGDSMLVVDLHFKTRRIPLVNPTHAWGSDPKVYDLCIQAAIKVLEASRPKGAADTEPSDSQ